jgi:hypothetical protein
MKATGTTADGRAGRVASVASAASTVSMTAGLLDKNKLEKVYSR